MRTRRRSARQGLLPFKEERPPLFQFVVLSMLLHLLLVVLIGDATRSAARRGEGFWGSLDVSLRGRSPEPGGELKLAPGSETLSPAPPLPRRHQGAADAPEAPRAEPPPTLEQPPLPESHRIDRPPPEALPPAQEAESLRAPPGAFEIVPPLDLDAPQEVDKPLVPPMVSPPIIERQPLPAKERTSPLKPVTPAPLERVVPRQTERELAPSVKVTPRELPMAPAPLERIEAPKIERELAPRVELTPREAPIAPAPLDRIVPRQTERELAPPVEVAPRELPAAPANIETIAPSPIERELGPPIEVAPRAQPIAPDALERIAPARIERELITPPAIAPKVAPALPAPMERMAPAQPSRELVSPSALPRSAEPGAGRTLPSMEREAAPRPPSPAASPPGESPPRLRFGVPQPDEEMFKPRRDVVIPSSEPGAAPRIDRDALRARVREIAREGIAPRALVEVELPQLERLPKNPFDKAAKPDCRTAYAGLGLLAIPALLASAIADSGCKW